MNLEVVISHWETIDALKIAGSVIAGIVLGVEREFKDKSAGLKTITTICLGSTLFTILSYKMGMGDSEDATRIASYIVSGIGFLGAGVIFKDGSTVSGLTTASIIWMAAAIGMSLGFGEFMLALGFLTASILIIHGGNVINRVFFDIRVSKSLTIVIDRFNSDEIQKNFLDISYYTKHIKEKNFLCHEDEITLVYDMFIYKNKLGELREYLLNNNTIKRFDM